MVEPEVFPSLEVARRRQVSLLVQAVVLQAHREPILGAVAPPEVEGLWHFLGRPSWQN